MHALYREQTCEIKICEKTCEKNFMADYNKWYISSNIPRIHFIAFHISFIY
jgi:hypothetical protein